MAINCVTFFNNPSTTIRQLQSEVEYSGTIANAFTGAFFKFELIEFETIFFDMFIQPNTVNGINVAFTLYRKDGLTFTNLGTSISDEFNNSFEYSASPGEYYICITTDFSVNYTLSAEFTDFPFVSIADAGAYGGAYMPPFEFAQPTAFCESAVYYEIIEGELPKGIELQSDGVISGVPIEQDCEDLAADQPPSFTWFEDDVETNTRTATGLKYRIVIRAALVDAPETYADREFFVCVHNNWDYDRDAFIDSIPNFETPVFEVKGEESWNDAPVEPVLPDEQLTPIQNDDLCTPCDTEVPTQLTIEEIVELTKQVYIAPEYSDLVKINDEGLCEVCPVEDTVDPLALEAIDVSFCEPCPDPTVLTSLHDIPVSMCPICIESTEVETSEEHFVVGIPEICYPDLLKRMMNTKVCLDYNRCGPTVAIYNESKKLSSDILPKTMCNPTCE